MKRKHLALFLLLSVLLSLAGCGEKSLLEPKEPVELTFWHVYGEQAGSPMDLLVDEFNRTVGQEKGVRVKVTAQSSASRIGELLMESQAENSDVEMPDLFTCHLSNAIELGVITWSTGTSGSAKKSAPRSSPAFWPTASWTAGSMCSPSPSLPTC